MSCPTDDILGDADVILLGAADGGADPADPAEDLQKRCARPDADSGDRFADRSLHLDTTFSRRGQAERRPDPAVHRRHTRDAGRPGQAAGPEDLRTKGQRVHDALDEAWR
jgi:hypothetical protein